jgi:hypothetical protein
MLSRSRAGESKKRLHVMVVGSAQRAHVASAQFAGIGEAAASSRKARAARPLDRKIGPALP